MSNAKDAAIASGADECGPECSCRSAQPAAGSAERGAAFEDASPIYLDHAATTPVRPEVLEAMLPFFTERFGNPSSIHKAGQSARHAVEHSREIVAECIGAQPGEICFTSGGTESDNLAIKGIAAASGSGPRHIVTSQVEHHAVLNACGYLEQNGVRVTYAPVDRQGVVDAGVLEGAIQPETVLVSIMLANNETGAMQPVTEIAAAARARGVTVHTDAVQAIGKVPVDVLELGVDLLSMSAHKIGGPKGVGALYVRTGTKIEGLMHGGHHERGRRAGTENVPLIVGFAQAMELARRDMPSESRRLAALRDRLESGILSRIPRTRINGHPVDRLPNILNVGFELVESDSLLIALDVLGIAASSGSACSSGALEPSHVLHAMKVDSALARGSLRFSLGRGNTEDQIDYVVDCLVELVLRLREMSPLYGGAEA